MSADIDPFDIPYKLSLPNVELVIIDCIDDSRVAEVLRHCMSQAVFGSVKFFTHLETKSPFKVEIPKIDSVSAYSEFFIKKLGSYIDLDYVLCVQHDGFIVNKEKWHPSFLSYDYIGAPWHVSQLGKDIPPEHCVGNGGFSLISKKLLTLLGEDDTFNSENCPMGDVLICQTKRPYLESKGIKFAPRDLANLFSNENYPWNNSFGQHNHFLLRKRIK